MIGSARPARRWMAGRDPGLTRLRAAAVTMAAALASFGSALLVAHLARLPAGIAILAVAIGLSVGRIRQRPGSKPPGLPGLLVLPLVAAGASEISTQMFEHPDLGDALFVLAVSASIWVRRFGPLATRAGALASVPLAAILIIPAPAITAPGSSGNTPWWAALIAVIALAWSGAVQLIAGRIRLLPRPSAPPALVSRAASPGPRSRRRTPASTRMALQMAAAIAAAFAVGRSLYPAHWMWVVLTAFIVCSGNRSRGDVAHKAVMRVLGAAAGTIVATALTGAFPPADTWSVVAIFAVLTIGLWLRPVNYAYWAAGMTAAMALLYGYYGQRGIHLLGDRVEAIAIGAALGIAASWIIFPTRTTDLVRRDLALALAALSDYLAAAGIDTAALPRLQARFEQAVAALQQATSPLQLLPPPWRAGHDYLSAVTALRQCAATLPAITRQAATASVSEDQPGTATVAAGITASITAIRRRLAGRHRLDPATWPQLAANVTALTAAIRTSTQPGNDQPEKDASSTAQQEPGSLADSSPADSGHDQSRHLPAQRSEPDDNRKPDPRQSPGPPSG